VSPKNPLILVAKSNLISLRSLEHLHRKVKEVDFLRVLKRKTNPKIQIFQVQEIININKGRIAEASQVLQIKIKVTHHKQLIIIRWPALKEPLMTIQLTTAPL
jgi:hypothetical protein